MPFYSDELIEEVRSANDIVDVISGYVSLQKKGGTYFGLCPFHNEKTGSFSVSRNKQMYYCFGCGAGGNVLTFIMQYENFTFPEAMQSLADRAGIALPKQEMSEAHRREADRRTRLLEINKEAARYYYALLRDGGSAHALNYLKKRELSSGTMQKFGLGYAGKYSDALYRYLKKKAYSDEELKESGLIIVDEKRGGHDRFWNRVMFPIMDVSNRVIGFGGRVMGEGEPKYLNSPETKIFDKSRTLYGLNLARSSRKLQILLCEGYMDVIALHQAGFDNAVASLGTAFTSGHASLLKRYTKEVCLTFDSDEAGIRAALRAIPILKEAGLAARVISMEPYKDPDEFIRALGEEAYQQRIDQAENSFLFEIRILRRDYDMKDPESKTAFYNEIAKRLLQFEGEMERENYIEAVSATFHIGFEQLKAQVRYFGTRGGLISERKKPLKTGVHDNRKKEDGMKQSQKLLLTWLCNEPKLFPVVQRYVTEEDFTEELYRKAAVMLYEQLRQGAVMPASIVSHFAGEEEQKEIAGLFNANIPPMESGQEKQKALKETIFRVKKNSIDHRSAHSDPADMEGMQKLIADRRQLESIEKLHISVD